MPELRAISLFEPAGMEASVHGRSPWEILVNACPTVRGWESLPGFSLVSTFVDRDGAYRGSGSFFDGTAMRHLMLTAGAANQGRVNTFSEGAKMVGASHYGEVGFALSDVGDDWVNNKEYAVCALTNRVFFSGGQNTYCLARSPFTVGLDSQTWNEGNSGEGVVDLKWCAVRFKPGISGTTFPYVSGPFGGKVLCAHRGRLFFAGFPSGYVVNYDLTITPDMLKVAKMTNSKVGPSQIMMSPQCLMWTDFADPFSIHVYNYQQLETKAPIVDLVSHKGELFILTTVDVWKMTGYDLDTFAVEKVCDNLGVDRAGNAVSTPMGVVFASPGGIFITDGKDVVRISDDIDPMFESDLPFPVSSNSTRIPFTLTRKFGRGCYVSRRNEVWIPVWSFSAPMSFTGGTTNAGYYYCLVYHLGLRAWSLAAAYYNSLLETWNNDFVALLPIGGAVFVQGNAAIYRMVDTMAPGQYQGIVMVSKPFSMEDHLDIAWQGVRLVWRRPPSSGTVYVTREGQTYEAGAAAPSASVEIVPYGTDTANVFFTGKYGTAKYLGASTFATVLEMGERGGYGRLCIYALNQNQMVLRGVEMLYKRLSTKPRTA